MNARDPELDEMRAAFADLGAAEQRVEDAVAAARAAGYVQVGVNRWEKGSEIAKLESLPEFWNRVIEGTVAADRAAWWRSSG